jgi:signal transduction histidine kinase
MIRKLWPKGLIGQLIVAIAVALFVAQAVNFVLLLNSQRQQAIAHSGGMMVARIVDGVERDRKGDFGGKEFEIPLMLNGPRERAINAIAGWDDGPRELAPPDEQPTRRGDAHPAFRLKMTHQAMPQPAGAEAQPDLAAYVKDRLNEAGVHAQLVRAWAMPEDEEYQRGPNIYRGRVLFVSADVNGRSYTARGRLPSVDRNLHGFLISQTLTLYLLLLGSIMLVAWRASKPLNSLTRAARANPMLRDVEPIAEEGPTDVRELIRAFNGYRARIDAMMADKDRMLGAVGHDLRTPLASLRVRVEQVDNDILRDKMITSIEEMTAMLADILALARAGSVTEAAEAIDCASLMQELAADFQEQGKDVTTAHITPLHIQARPMLVRRALRNLIGNAAAYGVRARLSVERQGDMAALIVSDDGPGMTAAQIATLVEPFARGEESRNRATGGAGLGLSIARDIAEWEKGRLELRTRAEGGLDAMILLPLAYA